MVRVTKNKDFYNYYNSELPSYKFYFFKNGKIVCVFFSNLNTNGIERFKSYLSMLNLDNSIMKLIASSDYNTNILAGQIINQKIIETFGYNEAYIDHKQNIVKKI